MTRPIVWKEFREQGAVLLALVGLGAGLMAATAILGGTTAGAEGLSLRTLNYTGRVLLVMLVLTAGTVAGGSLFAGEREAGTFAYLDHLPGRRWAVWWRKVLAGGLLAGLASALLLVAAGLAGQLGGTSSRVLVGWSLAVAVLAAIGFGWGTVGSVRVESSLGACGLGMATAGVTSVAVFLFAVLAMAVARSVAGVDLRLDRDEGGTAFLLAAWALVFVPLPLAAVLYTAPDRDRRLAEQDIRPERREFSLRLSVPVLRRRPGRPSRSRRMNWLLWRQLRAPLAVQAAVAAGVGLAVLPWDEFWLTSLFWPAAGLLLGVIVGVASLGDEQRTGAARFWAERRLPVGRLWRAKVWHGGMLALGVCVVALLPAVLAAVVRGEGRGTLLSTVFHSGLFEPGFPYLTYLLLGPVYGFAFGHLAGMLFRKGIVAGAVGLMTGGVFGAVWGPSLLAGGVHGWVVFVPAGVALLTARWLAWPWAVDQLGRRGPLLRLAGGTAVALVCVAAGLGHRAVGEVEVVENADAHLKFRDALPTFDERQAGRDIRRALAKWQELPQAVREDRSDTPPDGRPWADAEPAGSPGRRYVGQMPRVLRSGWPEAGRLPELDRWLDAVFRADWDEPVFAAAAKPVGVLEDPNEYTPTSPPLKYARPLAELTPVFLARGLQQQARGDPAAFVDRLAAWLAAVRTAKHHTVPTAVLVAEAAERQVYLALDRWLERVSGRPDLVRRALDAVRRHDALDRVNPADVRLAEQVLVQNAVDAPGQWLARWLDYSKPGLQPADGGRASPGSEAEANVVGFSWAVPWEKERLRRVVALGNDPARRGERADLLRGAPGLGIFEVYDRYGVRQDVPTPGAAAARRAAALTLALRLHKLEAGAYPPALSALVPNHLPAVPDDPFDRQPFRYRVLAGPEVVTLPTDLAPADRPQLPPGGLLGYDDYLLAAGLAGGLTGWPFQPGWYTPTPDADTAAAAWRARGFAAGGGPAGLSRPLPMAAEWQVALQADAQAAEHRLAAGRAVLWSVGPDRADGGGRQMGPGDGRLGDLIFVVPDPPAGR